MSLDNLIDKAKDAAAGIKDKVGDPSAKISDAVLDILGDLNDALPYLSKAGFTMNELEIEVGIPPKLIPHFTVDETLVINTEQSKTDLEGNMVGSALYKALLTAIDLQQKIVIDGMGLARVEIELGLVPAVRIAYKR